MRTTTPHLAFALSLVLATASASGVPEPARSPAPAAEAEGDGASELHDALDGALDDPGSRASFRALVECVQDGETRTLEIFGSGIGIWERRRQFELAPETVEEVLRRLLAADFVSFEPYYGKREEEEENEEDAPKRPQKGQPPLVVCRVSIAIGELAKQVVQVDEGEQHEPLRELAGAILELCAPLAETGVEASDLGDGLDRLARGELAPETWQLLLQIVPERRSAGGADPGLWLKVEGNRAFGRPVDVGGALGGLRELELTDDEVAALAGALAAERPDELPGNLWASDYTSLSLRVLDRSLSIQARRFAGMTADGLGASQERFERILERLTRLYEKVRGGRGSQRGTRER